MSITSQPGFLRTVLNVDAATCVATGLLMTLGGNFLSGITQIPSSLLTAAGLSLFPVAAFILLVATRTSIPSTGVWSVVLGNIAWVLASLWLLFGSQTGANGLGLTFIAMQAIAVAALAELEIIGVRKQAYAAQ